MKSRKRGKRMSREYIVFAIFVSAGITFGLRALPFVIFHGKRKMPQSLIRLGQMLPAAIMAVLIIYCLKDGILAARTTGIAQLLAVLAVAITYKWKHNTMLSIVLGTAVYMLLIHVVG